MATTTTTTTTTTSTFDISAQARTGANVINDGDLGNRNLVGTSKNDIIFGNGGDDVIDGLGGADIVLGGAGNDTLIYNMSQNIGVRDNYAGNGGADQLVIQFSYAQWIDRGVQADIAHYLSFLAQAGREAPPFAFKAFGLTAAGIETFNVRVDGMALDPVDQRPVLAADTLTTAEDTRSASIDVLANDSIPDLAASVAFTQGAHGAVTRAGLDLTHPAGGQSARFVYTPAANYAGPDTFRYTVTDADGDVRSAVVNVNVTPVNDAAVISGTSTGTVTEAGGVANALPGMPTATGNLTDTDIDNPANSFLPVAAGQASAGGHGSYAMTAGGAWTYTLSDTDGTVQALNAGGTLQDTFQARTVDGTAQTVTILIKGANDAATLGTGVANLVEGDTAAAISNSGTLAISDVDDPATFVQQAATAGQYGTFGIGANGAWTYAASSAHDEFIGGTTYTDTFAVASADGTATQVTINMLGANENSAVVLTSAAQAGKVTEDADTTPATTDSLSATGLVTFTDADRGDTHTATLSYAPAGNAPPLGTFSAGPFTDTGSDGAAGSAGWRYDLDNSAAQSLAAGQTVTEKFRVTIDDHHGSTVSQDVDITIEGTGERPTLPVGGISYEILAEAGMRGAAPSVAFLDVDGNHVANIGDLIYFGSWIPNRGVAAPTALDTPLVKTIEAVTEIHPRAGLTTEREITASYTDDNGLRGDFTISTTSILDTQSGGRSETDEFLKVSFSNPTLNPVALYGNLPASASELEPPLLEMGKVWIAEDWQFLRSSLPDVISFSDGTSLSGYYLEDFPYTFDGGSSDSAAYFYHQPAASPTHPVENFSSPLDPALAAIPAGGIFVQDSALLYPDNTFLDVHIYAA